eukprot:19253-Heterococcus_DN1.PRE.2
MISVLISCTAGCAAAAAAAYECRIVATFSNVYAAYRLAQLLHIAAAAAAAQLILTTLQLVALALLRV